MSDPSGAAPAMPMQRLGRTGLLVSRLSFGSWVTFSYQLDANPACASTAHAQRAGARARARQPPTSPRARPRQTSS